MAAKDLVEYVARSLVDQPDEVSVEVPPELLWIGSLPHADRQRSAE